MKRCLMVAFWGLGLLWGVNGLWANNNVHDFNLGGGLERAPFGMPNVLEHFLADNLYLPNEDLPNGVVLVVEDDLYPPHYEAVAEDLLNEHIGVLRLRLEAFARLGGADFAHYLGAAHAGNFYPIQLILETIERTYPDAMLLSVAQRTVLERVYDEVAEIIRLISRDESLLVDNERCHVVEVLGLLLRASGCSLQLREMSFKMLSRYFASERGDFRLNQYIEIWSKALASGHFPYQYIHSLRRILINCAGEDSPDQTQKAAMRALGMLMGNATLSEFLQADIVRMWMDFYQQSSARGVEAVVQGMQLALRGEFLTDAIRTVIFEALLLCPHSSNFAQFQNRVAGHLIDRALLDTWAEGLRAGWFDSEALVQLVPVIMEYRFIVDCPIRTRGVLDALVGLLHARAEDSTFRTLVYQHIGEILFYAGQSTVIINRGVQQLSQLFVHVELPEWERTKIIAYLVALLPYMEDTYMSGPLVDALLDMLGCESLSVWEQHTILSLIGMLCADHGADLELRGEDIIRAVERFREQRDQISDQDGALLDAIVKALPIDDDDLDSDDDDLYF